GDRPQVARLDCVAAHRLHAGPSDLLAFERHVHPDDVRGGEQTLDVLLQAKDRRLPALAFVAANPFEDAESVVERVGQDVTARFVPRDEYAVHPDVIGLAHRRRRPNDGRSASQRDKNAAGGRYGSRPSSTECTSTPACASSFRTDSRSSATIRTTSTLVPS